MPQPVILLVVFAVSVLASLAAAARLTRVKIKTRTPEHHRPWSDSRVPRLGGVAVFIATPVAFLVAPVIRTWVGSGPTLPERAGALIAAAAVLFAVGLLDDLRRVRPVAKLIAQTGAALVICSAGFKIEHVTFLPGYTVNL